MATQKAARKPKRQVKVIKTDKALPKYGFVTLYFIDYRARRIVQGKVELINTIHKPDLDGEKRQVGVYQTHYYSLRTEVFVERQNIVEEELYTTQDAAAKKLGSQVTDYLK